MRTSRFSITSVLISVYLIIDFVPVFYRALSFTSLFLIIGIALLNLDLIFKKPYLYLLAIPFVLCLWEVFFLFAGISKTQIGYIFYVFRFFTCGIILFPSISRLSVAEKKMIFWSWFIPYSFTIVHNIVLRFTLGEAYFNFQEDASLAEVNIADTYYGTAVLICMCASLIVLLNRSEYPKYVRSKLLIVFALSVSFILITSRMTTILLGVLSSILLVLFNKKQKRGIVAISCVFVAVFLLLLFSGLGAIIVDSLAKLDLSQRIKDRLESISFVLRTGDFVNSKSSLSGRFKLTMNSWNTWTSSTRSFLFGIGDQRDNFELIGNHSYFLDTLARFGIFYFALVTVFIVVCHKLAVKRVDSPSLRAQCLVILLTFLSRNIVGNSAYVVVGMSLYVVLPLLFSMRKDCFYEEKKPATIINGVLVS